MLFNSFYFLLIFLPVTFITWYFLKTKTTIRFALVWLSSASLFFYAMWNVNYLFILLASISINFFLGARILNARRVENSRAAQIWMVVGVSFNLLVLGIFKYSYFFVSNLFELFHHASPIDPIALPLAISFVTFQKIAYLVDCRRGLVSDHNAIDYLFFVSFFPQLIAGPIVHHKPLISQTDIKKNPLFLNPSAITAGLLFLGIGLFKKVIIADSLAHYATPVFTLATQVTPSGESSWQAMFAYTLQLYFDFSGYSDMAIGLALLFGFKLPINFLSPYKANSIIDFWRRWHITLSTFLRDYLYIPLGGNRNGEKARLRNLWITMVLAGLWHGAGWTFLLWGIFHGCLLLINQMWRSMVKTNSSILTISKKIINPIKISFTFLFVAFGWVLFRSADMLTASRMYEALLNPFSGDKLPTPQWNSHWLFLENFLSAATNMGWIWISLGLIVVMTLPSSSQLLKYDPLPNTNYEFKPSFKHGLLIGICFWAVFKWMAVRPATEFLYFNF